jgi:ABC-type multidrug transport system ATPase subunit
VLSAGCRLSIGPYQFTFDGLHLDAVDTVSATLALGCLDVSRYAIHRVTGERLTLLHQLSLAVTPRELVCLIGPSGCGKSTLLSTLAGRVLPDRGRVLYGGVNLHAAFDAVKHDIAVVPQREALHGGLTVRQSLWYAAGLRLPADTSADELNHRVEGLLDEVGLTGRSAVRVRNLSGGQRKRLCLAIEICHTPRMIFIDEVTSGLDELADADMMRLFRGLAERGRSLVCITHNTLNIERYAHLVVMLTAGGRLACVGTPAEVCNYFGVDRLGDAYKKMSERQPPEWEQRFRQHSLFRQYVQERMPAAAQHASTTVPGDAFRSVSARRPISFARQFRLLAGRVATLQIMDLKSLMLSVGQAIFIGVMLAAVFGDLAEADDAMTAVMKCQNTAFLLLVAVFWLGCNNSAPEIVKERILFERERAVSVDAGTYYLAKLAILGCTALLQAMIVFGIVDFVCGLPALPGGEGLVRHTITIAAVAMLGTLTGLAISAISRTEELAVRTVPVVLIPQIVLANVIAPLEGWLDWLARAVVSTFWSFRAFTSGVEDYCRPGDEPVAWLPAMGMLGVHAAVVVIIALIGLRPPKGSDGR